MKMEKMHQNALICIRMRMLKNNTTFVKKQHVSPLGVGFMWPCLLFLYTYALQVR